ncbi:MAG: hypothetical protein P9X22_06880 [Candidatus Zapsychrus exili]|nr:hypothetical protein [Candidatus Zapsychrus exili]
MKKVIIFLTIFLLFCGPALAFIYEISIPTQEEIKRLKDDEIIEIYIDVMIERKASEAFHGKAGFTPKEYTKFKELLGFIVRLRQEMSKRELEAPPIDEWLR